MNGGEIIGQHRFDHRVGRACRPATTRSTTTRNSPAAMTTRRPGSRCSTRYFDRVVRPHQRVSAPHPWYSVFGNHDDSINGLLPSSDARSTSSIPDDQVHRIQTTRPTWSWRRRLPAPSPSREASTRRRRTTGRSRRMSDESRSPQSDFMTAHLAPDAVGPGPSARVHAPRRRPPTSPTTRSRSRPESSVSRSTRPTAAGFMRGSIGTAQLRWLDETLKAGTSRYFDAAGNAGQPHRQRRPTSCCSATTPATHHGQPAARPGQPLELRHLGPELVELVQRYPTVLAVGERPHPLELDHRASRPQRPERSFWEINTASHIEFPQQARIIEVCDNRDGTLSLFTTLHRVGGPVPGGVRRPEPGRPRFALPRVLVQRPALHGGAHGNSARPEHRTGAGRTRCTR